MDNKHAMRWPHQPWAVLVLTACVLSAGPAFAQTGGGYELSWTAIPGGSGTASGGTYLMSSSTGQPVAGTITGGSYEIRAGFWAIPTPRPGDVDGDGTVDAVDLLWLVDSFGAVTGDMNYRSACDFNRDGSIDVVDLLILVENFGT